MSTRTRAARARAWFGRVRRIAGYVPVRAPGVLFGAGAAALWWFSHEHADYLLHPASLVALGLLALCGACAGLAALSLWWSLRRDDTALPDRLETTRAVRTGFRFARLIAWPLVEVRMTWEHPPGVEVALAPAGRWFEETVTAHERGRHERVVRRFVVEDIFGLTAVAFRRAVARPLVIVPAPSARGPAIAAGHAAGDGFSHPLGEPQGDLIEMRAYGHGDPLRHVLWKTFARTRRLLVRMPERAISPRPTTSAYLVAGAGDEPAAATARLYVEAGLLGEDFVFAADGAAAPTSEAAQALELIVDSVQRRADGAAELDAFRRGIEPVRLGRCVVFAPPSDGAWCERVAAFSRALPAPALVIIGVDGDVAAPPRRRAARWLLRDRGRAAVHRELGTVRAKLEAAGLQVKVLHRASGQVLE